MTDAIVAPQWASRLRDIADFPKPGILFKDIMPLLAHGEDFRGAITAMADRWRDQKLDAVVGIESRGFILGAAMALELGVGFVPVRKPGKLPRPVFEENFALEYGTETLTVHRDAIKPGARVLVVDDVLATGGTIGATAQLLKKLDVNLVHVATVMELSFLGGRAVLDSTGIDSFSTIVTV